ncbi:MAG: hypothetical protein DMF32_00445 [Verrucomicrobia bacterium]|nr:MAG: hypothetical protein DMF32_00445 [Verrucomicrobiota bacterium]
MGPCRAIRRTISDPLTDTLRVPVSRIRGPEIPSQIVDLRQGIGPDEAATIALIQIQRSGRFGIVADSRLRN